MSIDLHALVHALRGDPEQRTALRDALGIDDIDVQGALQELTRVQARTETRADARLDELAKDVLQLSQQVGDLTRAVQGLIDVTAGMQDRLAKLDGSDLGRRYRERGPAYLLRIARRLRLIDSSRLAEMVDDGEEGHVLSQREAESIMVADAVFTGRRRDDGMRVHLVVEVSVTIARHDVRRARERADLLSRIVDTPVVAVVAGDHVGEPVAQAAQDADVWCVTRGRVLSPVDDLDELV